MLTYVLGQELGSWEATIILNGDPAVDFSTGWTFQVTAAVRASTTALFTKTTGITGGTGTITTAWAASGELNALTAPNVYDLQLRARRTADTRDLYIVEQITIEPVHV